MERTQESNTGVIQWRKLGGGSFVATINGRAKIIKPNETFFARPDEIPTSFKDLIVPVDPTELSVKQVEEKVEVEKATAPKFELRHRGGGWWNVVDEDGKIFNEKALKREEAEELLESLK